MSSKDRNKNIPLGTFGASHPPPPLDEAAAESQPPQQRRSNKATLVGHPAVPAGSLAPSVPPPAPEGSVVPGGRRSSVPNTLVGHPRPEEARAASQGPFLAPPKWQGASAYEGEEQPELQVGRGSRPSAPEDELEPERAVSTAPSVPVGAAGDASASAGSAAASAAVAEGESEASSGPNLDDSIQRMLDEQTAVPLEVDEAATPDIELSASDIEVQSVLAAARPKPITSKPPPTPAAVSSKPPRPASDEIARIPMERAPAPAPSVSLAPAEVASEPPDDSNAGLGVLMVAAMAVIGVGGWLLTQGTYQRPQAAAAPAPAPAAAPVAPAPLEPVPAPTTVPPVTSPTATAVVPAPTAPPPVAAPAAPAPAAPAPAVQRPVASPSKAAPAPTRRAARRAKPAVRAAPARETQPAAPPPSAAPAEESTLKPVNAYPGAEAAPAPSPKPAAVKPELLPDTPSRADVVAALDPVRPKVAACAGGVHGVAEVDITVQSSGQVSHAVVRGDFAGTPAGSCIARAVRSANFGPFKQPRFRVVYPFSL